MWEIWACRPALLDFSFPGRPYPPASVRRRCPESDRSLRRHPCRLGWGRILVCPSVWDRTCCWTACRSKDYTGSVRLMSRPENIVLQVQLPAVRGDDPAVRAAMGGDTDDHHVWRQDRITSYYGELAFQPVFWWRSLQENWSKVANKKGKLRVIGGGCVGGGIGVLEAKMA